MHLAVFLLDSPLIEAREGGSFYFPSTTHITLWYAWLFAELMTGLG